jgi:PAS domain S-box-containing protein
MQITKFISELSIALEQVTVYLQRVQSTFTGAARRIADQRRRLQEQLQEREDELQNLVTRSLDAVVVTTGDRRFIFANRRALDLFGVSEANLRKFTLDAFVSYEQMLEFNRNGAPFVRRSEKHGKCKIRRLGGDLRVADYIFQADFAPLRDLYMFRNVVTPECDPGQSYRKARLSVGSKTG